MENLKEYNDFLFEKRGVSPVIYNDLEFFFSSVKYPAYEEAKKFIAKSHDGWDLSKEDYEEAKKMFRKGN
jgi:hypothetical protein